MAAFALGGGQPLRRCRRNVAERTSRVLLVNPTALVMTASGPSVSVSVLFVSSVTNCKTPESPEIGFVAHDPFKVTGVGDAIHDGATPAIGESHDRLERSSRFALARPRQVPLELDYGEYVITL